MKTPMKVMLVASNIASSPYPTYPLGVSMIAAALRDAGHEVVQFDFLKSGLSLEALSDVVKDALPALIGISVRNIDNVNLMDEKHYISVVRDIVRTIRTNSSVPIVLGGAGFSIIPEQILKETGADYGIVGEGESQIIDFVSRLQRGLLPVNACLRQAQKLSGKDIPSANYDAEFMKFYLKRGGIAPIQTKRGCSLNCIYCPYPHLEGHQIRCRDPKAVVDDIRTLVDSYGARYIFFTDSVFNDNEGYYLDIIRTMKKESVCIPWTAFFKPDNLDDKNVALMKETGLKAAELGSDASSDRTLRRLGKPFLFEDIVACTALFKRHGIAAAHYYMFGGPGETPETVMEGIENIKSLGDTVCFIYMGIRILPGTGLAELARAESIISPEQELLEPVYYISPKVERKWLEKTLTDAFSKIRHCVFPPDSLDSSLEFVYQLGYTGSMWEFLTVRKHVQKKSK